MSLGIAFKGPEGIVLAADSRVTLTAQVPQQNMLLPSTFDNATKLLHVASQPFVGVVTYGLGALGQRQPRTAHSFMPEFEDELQKGNGDRLSVSDFADNFSDFFMRQWAKTKMPKDYKGPDMTFLVAGYDAGKIYGSIYEISIPRKPQPQVKYDATGGFGVVWGGQREFTDRLIQGFDDQLPAAAQKFLKLSAEQGGKLRDHLKKELQVNIPFAFLPLQDCVDVAVFLIRTTITIQSWIVGVRGVGGAIDVATITRTESFNPIQQKAIAGERG